MPAYETSTARQSKARSGHGEPAPINLNEINLFEKENIFMVHDPLAFAK